MIGRADAVGDIEAEPAEAVDMRFRPGMMGLRLDVAVGSAIDQIAGDIARRNAEPAGWRR